MEKIMKKDLSLLKSQKLYMIYAILLVFSLYIGWGSPFQGMVICSMASGVSSLVPITYAFDRKYSKELHLPENRVSYILEKYVLSFLCISSMSILCGFIMSILFNTRTISNPISWITTVVLCIMASMLVCALSILIHLEVVAIRARAITFIIAFIVFYLLSNTIFNSVLKSIANILSLSNLWLAKLIIIFTITLVIVLLMIISIKRIKKIQLISNK